MAPPRVKWDPAQHPRSPVGRFISVGGTRGSQREPDRLSKLQGYELATGVGSNELDNHYGSGRGYESIRALTDDERGSVQRYVKHGPRINETIRDGDSEFWSNDIARLDAAIETGRLSDDTTVYRGNRLDLSELQPGDQIYDRGFTSTSLSPSGASYFGRNLLEIEIPAGTHVAMGDPLDREYILGRGAVLQVDSIEDDRIRTRLVGYVDD